MWVTVPVAPSTATLASALALIVPPTKLIVPLVVVLGPPLGNAVQPAVEVQVLDRRQLTVDERFVPEEADPLPRHFDLELACGRDQQPGDQP